jgi:hypothetical protein
LSRAAQFIPFDTWGSCSLFTVNKAEDVLQCALHSGESRTLVLFSNIDESAEANPEKGILRLNNSN